MIPMLEMREIYGKTKLKLIQKRHTQVTLIIKKQG